MDLTLLLILVKYKRYTSHFIGLVHIFMLYTSSLCWLIHDNYCIVYTLPDACFACYRLAHDDGKCTNCMSLLLHRIDIDCFRVEFRFFLFLPSSLQFGVSIRVHISLAFVGFTICSTLQIAAVSSSWIGTHKYHMPVVVKTCSFITAKLVSKYCLLCSIRCHHFCILCN